MGSGDVRGASFLVIAGTVLVATATLMLFWFIYKLRPVSFSLRCRPPKTFAFFHPYANGGGGGERVLWKMIQFLQQLQQQQQGSSSASSSNNTKEEMEIVIYTIDPPTTKEDELRRDAEQRFYVQIPKPIRLVSLEEYKDCLRPRPFLSLVMETYGTMQLARHALSKFQPDVFCDTTGCAFTFAVVRWVCHGIRALSDH
jgi:alpha-1,2-mannosyltransferase